MKITMALALFALMLSGAVNAAEIPQSANEIRPLLIGAEVPDVTLNTPEGTPLELRKVVTEKPTILIFYRGGWCPYCNRHLAGIQQVETKLVSLGYRILAVSPDRPEKLRETTTEDRPTYQLLSDSSMAAASAFGIAFRLDDATFDKYKNSYKIDIEADSGETHHLLPVPSVFIVNTDGRIAFSYVNPDYKIRLTPNVLIAAAESILQQKGGTK